MAHEAPPGARPGKLVRRLVKGEKVTQAESGLQPREWRELAALLGIDPA